MSSLINKYKFASEKLLMKTVESLETSLLPYRNKLLKHPLYNKLKTEESIKVFMSYHSFAVWDFMSLVKSLQLKLTSTQIPWTPVGNPSTRRLINEIVWGEESDVDKNNNPFSHYELYVQSMDKIGADSSKIKNLVSLIENGTHWREALIEVQAPKEIFDFVDFSLTVATEAPVHIVAGVFTFGREDLIPDLFIEIVRGLSKSNDEKFDDLLYYLERHIELDGDEHGPMALQMIQELCENDSQKIGEALAYSQKALQHRLKLWDFISTKI